MHIKSFFSKLLAKVVVAQTKKWSNQPIKSQERVFKKLLASASKTAFAKEHYFSEVRTYEDFKKRVPVRDYEEFRPYIERVKEGEEDVLWNGRPLFFAKTSGTTSGAKYIPLTKESLKMQIKSARNALLHYIYYSGSSSIVEGKMIFLQGSPTLNSSGFVPSGRLSGIVANYVPSYLHKNRLPSYETNCIDDWEKKVDAIVEETKHEDMRLISGIPSWVQMYMERLKKDRRQNIGDIFSNFSLFVYGGVNYEPYRKNFEQLIGREVDTLELYPASEGFIAFQDRYNKKGLLLQLDSGIFYEFIPAGEFYINKPSRISLKDVQLGVNYVIILTTNAGLWAYNIGDTIEFISLNPYRIIVTGRIKHYISAFGEHVISKEVEESMRKAIQLFPEVGVREFTVAPEISPEEGLPYHEWLVEFSSLPNDMLAFSKKIDQELQLQNTYYRDLIQGKVLTTLKITALKKNAFQNYMKQEGRLGGQNKVARLSNNRGIAEKLRG